MRALPFLALSLLALTADAAIQFLAPLPGSQLIGPRVIEISSERSDINRVDFKVDDVLVGVARKAPWRIMYDFGTTGEVRRVSAELHAAGFRIRESATVSSSALSTSATANVDLVEVPLEVSGSSRGIRISELQIFENDRLQKILDLTATRPPADFYFIVDRSLSMSGGRLEKVIAAVKNAQTSLRKGDTAKIVFFNHQVAQARDLRDLEETLPVPSGGTSLRDALTSVQPQRRSYLIAITDGVDRTSLISESAALSRLNRKNITLNALVFSRDSETRFLSDAASRTGGRTVHTNSEELPRALQEVLAGINSRWTATYQSTGNARGWRSIRVIAKARGLKVTSARKGYQAE